MKNSAVVIAKKDTYKTFADLKGKRIGMENGTTHQKYIQDQHPEVKTVSYDSYQECLFIDLKNGRIDGYFGDTAGGKRMAEKPIHNLVLLLRK